MSDEELKRMVAHLAELHGVSPAKVVAEISDQELPDDEELEQGSEDVGKPKRKGRAHWTAWTSAMVVMGAVVGLLIIGAMKFITDPAAAAMAPRPSISAAPSGSPTPGISTLIGTVVSLSYPGEFDAVAEIKTDPQSLEQYTLGDKADYHHLITVEVRPLPSGDLTQDSSYMVRHIDPTDYHESSQKIGGAAVVMMTKTDGQEQTMFWVHNADLLTVAVTSSDSSDNISDMMAVISNSVRWNK